MHKLFEAVYGSRLFGVEVEDSDTDIKGVHCVSFEDLVLGKTDPISENNGKTGKEKVERESHFIRTFCKMVEQGQTLTCSMLFTPRGFWTHSTPEWEELIAHRHLLISKRMDSYVGYARSQAQKYSLKGERLNTLKNFIEYLSILVPRASDGRLTSDQFQRIYQLFGSQEGVRCWTEGTTPPVRHIEVCGKSFGETTPLKLWIDPLNRLFGRFGKRAMNAMEAEGSDLKAMYHAVRLTGEMNELLSTGKITYPRPDAPLLRQIRQGEFTNGEVADMIDSAVVMGEGLMKTSTLRDTIDSEWLQSWMLKTQRKFL